MSANPYQPPQSDPAETLPVSGNVWRPKRWMIAMSAIGLVLGMISRLSRPYMNFSNLHWDALISVALLALISLTLLIRCYRMRFIIANGYYQSGLISLWTAFVNGWSLVKGSVLYPLVETCVFWWFGLAIVGLIVLAIPHRVHETESNKPSPRTVIERDP